MLHELYWLSSPATKGKETDWNERGAKSDSTAPKYHAYRA
jgi:hypothetical protein